MIRSKVDLPDPDGPRNAMNSRASSVRLTSSSTGVAPKLFRTPLSCRLATHLSPSGVRLYRSCSPPQRRSCESAERRWITKLMLAGAIGFERTTEVGWGGRIRTCECRYQKPVPYHLATPQQAI